MTAVVGLLEATPDPVARAIAAAPLDDEPLSPEQEKALAESDDWLKHHEPISFEEVLGDLGITQ